MPPAMRSRADCPASDMDHPVVRWLMTDARAFTGSSEFLNALGECLLKAGVDVARISTGVPILHPQVFSFSGLWQAGKGASERINRFGDNTTSALDNSPIRITYAGGAPQRFRLVGSPATNDFPIVRELRAEGFTDYVVLAVPFADGSHKALTFASRKPSGFTEAEIALFQELVPGIGFHLEIQALRRTARTLLDTYVGQLSGGRVLDGHIRRGMGETIRAVIWLCDLRGFTALSERLPRDQLIDALNAYFGPMCDAVSANGGEILKFIGDAMLAIFPAASDAARACQQALAASAAAQAALSDENRARVVAGKPQIDYGIALHVGDVMYGNIGSDTRLDFTVIGPAVNLTARIEGLCSKLGRSLLLSADFAGACGVPTEAVGEFELKGVAAKQAIYASRA
jgi:adenylate cyclase